MTGLPLWGRILLWVAVAMACVLAIKFTVGAYESHMAKAVDRGDERGAARVKGEWDKDIKTRDDAHARELKAAITEAARMARAANQGEKDALEQSLARARADLAAAGRAAADGRQLRDSIAAANAAALALDMPSVAACPGQFVEQRALAVRARDLLGRCSARLESLAAGTDRAFTGLTLKLDTALSYITAVAPKTP